MCKHEAQHTWSVEEKAARLERKRRRLAAEAAGLPPLAVWNNSNWEQEDEDEDEDDGAGVGFPGI